MQEIYKVHFIFSHCGLGSPLGVRGEIRKKRKNEMHPIYTNPVCKYNTESVIFYYFIMN